MSVKKYPLEVEAYLENYGYWSKGHHDKQEFVDAVKKEWGEELFSGAVKYEWARHRPALPHERENDGYAWYHVKSEKGMRGAFPITVVRM